MKALSVRQPWASLIAEGLKTIEVRSRRTKYRGPLLICASKKLWPGAASSAPRGVAVAVVEIVDCRPLEPRDAKAARVPFKPDQFAWVVRLLYRVEPEAVTGRLGLFEVPLTVIRKSRRIA
jgi:hypothetical protein